MITVLAALALLTVGLVALGSSGLGPTPRAAWLLGGCALTALVSPPIAIGAAAAGCAAFVVDAWMARARPSLTRTVARVFARGGARPLRVDGEAAGTLRVRQPVPPDVVCEPSEADVPLDAEITGRRRGRHELPRVATRVTGPLGLAAWFRDAGEPSEMLVFPDVPTARDLALQVRQGRFREAGRRSRGPLGLGTDFESIRDYLPDDDVRQINWSATERTGRPMSNVYRVEQDRDVMCVVDGGRLMAAPIGTGTRLDVAADAAVSVALVADAVGDRCGLIAFDTVIRRELAPQRGGGDAVVRALFDFEPAASDADYELAFLRVGRGKRAFVLVLTDLLDEAAATSLLEAVPVLVRRHAVAIASARDPEIDALIQTRPTQPSEVYTASAAVHVLDARALVVASLRRLGADVIEAPAERLGRACVAAYLRAKQRARL